MGLFSNRRGGGSGGKGVVPPEVLEALPLYGKARLGQRASQEALEARFGWDFVGPIVTAAQGPNRDRVIQELYDAANAAQERELAVFGAYSLLTELHGVEGDRRFLELCDASLEYMRKNRFSSGHLTRPEADRWLQAHDDLRSSFDGIVDVPVQLLLPLHPSPNWTWVRTGFWLSQAPSPTATRSTPSVAPMGATSSSPSALEFRRSHSISIRRGISRDIR